MERIAYFILRFRYYLLIAILFITGFLLHYVPGLEMKDDVSTWFSKDDLTLIQYRNFQDTFEESQFAVVAYAWDSPFATDEIIYLSQLTDSLTLLPHIQETVSLSNAENIIGTDYGLEVGTLFDKEHSIPKLKHLIRRNPFIYGNLISKDFQTVSILLILEQKRDENKSLGEYNREIDLGIKHFLKQQSEKTGRQFHIGGELINDAAINELMDKDISLFFPLSMLISALFLWIIFRNISSIIFPLLTVGFALIWVLGLKGFVNSPITPVSTTLFALITIIGLANSIHLISQFRLEFNGTTDKTAAIVASLRKAGIPCFFTSLTTAIGFGSLISSPIPGITNLGSFAALGIPQIRIEGSMLEYLKHGTTLYQDTKYLDQHLSGISTTEIILKGDTDCFKNPTLLAEIETLQKHLATHQQVSVSYSVADYLKMIYRSLNSDDEAFYRIPETPEAIAQCLLIYEISGGKETEKYLTAEYDVARISIVTKQMDDLQNRQLFNVIDDHLESNFTDLEVQVTGFDYLVNQLTGNIIRTQISSLQTAFLIILILMMLIFGPKLGFLSILPNVFPVVFILGLMGWAEFRLNMATTIIASVAIGIVVDDTIHYFTHFTYEYRKTGNIHQSMRSALLGVGRALIFTSLILTTGFLIFILSQTRILMDFGILASIAIFTALLGDLFIGPVLLSSFDVLRKKIRKYAPAA